MKEKKSPSFWISFTGDWVAATVTTITITPVVAIIDRAIVSNAAGTVSLKSGLYQGCKELTHPLKFARQPNVLAVSLVYFATYGAANSADTISRHLNQPPGLPILISSSAANMGFAIWKDQFLARLYGGSTNPKPLPLSSYSLFAVRDVLTMGACFTLPPYLSEAIQEHYPKLGKAKSDTLSQFLLPTSMQLITTPLHLLALDIYNNPTKTISDRVRFLIRESPATLLTRMIRVLPAYGCGGTVS
ncbi:hypothetical protein HK098_000414 [Nowakowskiella sp. JEL0407]|nr:hypothetical protein HK098_000414 [Nowakowskiella sp. JEL0407]